MTHFDPQRQIPPSSSQAIFYLLHPIISINHPPTSFSSSSPHPAALNPPTPTQVALSQAFWSTIELNWWLLSLSSEPLFAVFGMYGMWLTLSICFLILSLLCQSSRRRSGGSDSAQQHHPLPHCRLPGLERDQWATHTHICAHTEAEALLRPPNYGLRCKLMKHACIKALVHANERQRQV